MTKNKSVLKIPGLILVAVLMLINQFQGFAGEYAVKNIPEELLKDANSVIRSYSEDITFKGPGQYTIRVEKVVTILNENGKDFALLAVTYDKNSSVQFIEGELLDAEGTRLERIRNRDLIDQSFVNDLLYSDTRITAYIPRISNYPYTVRYNYEYTSNRGIYYLYPFYPVRAYNQSAQKSHFRLRYPMEFGLEIRENNIPDGSRKTEKLATIEQTSWTFRNIPARKEEFLSPPFHEVVPAIVFSPIHFEYSGYRGSGESWEKFGQWLWTLNNGRDVLPESRANYLYQLVKDLKSDEEKAKVIFRDMQTRTRYVNISLGIGGIQTFDAATVDKNGYGDCKALSNYYASMLRAVGIEAYYTLIMTGTGEYDFYPDFPTSQFNHVIVCVPNNGDTLWVECTNQQIPFAYKGTSNDNRHVLLITENGGVLAKTPTYKRQDNFTNTLAKISLNTEGNGTAKINKSIAGQNYGSIFGYAMLGEEDQRKWLLRHLSLSDFRISGHKLSIVDDRNPVFNMEVDVTLRNHAKATGQRLFVPLNPLSAIKEGPPRIRSRQTSFELKYEQFFADTVVLKLPRGFVPESALPVHSFTSDFGSYNAHTELKEDEIWYIRQLETYSGKFEPQRYQDYVSFYQSIIRADEAQVVLIRN